MTSGEILVVAAALFDDLEHPTRVLAARRTRPADLAGCWEFPGGKVEAGEAPETALRRELSEELGIKVVLGDEIMPPRGETWPLTGRLVLRLWSASITSGTPEPLEVHDELRWLTPGELDTVEWLPPDRPMLPHLFR